MDDSSEIHKPSEIVSHTGGIIKTRRNLAGDKRRGFPNTTGNVKNSQSDNRLRDLEMRLKECEQENQSLKLSIGAVEKSYKEHIRRCEATKKSLMVKLVILRRRLNDSRNELEPDKRKLREKICELRTLLEESNKQFDKKVRETFGRVFSPSQLDIIMKQKVHTKWSEEDLKKALTLRYLNKRSFMYVCSQYNYPLPGKTSLSRFAREVERRYEIISNLPEVLQPEDYPVETAEEHKSSSFESE